MSPLFIFSIDISNSSIFVPSKTVNIFALPVFISLKDATLYNFFDEKSPV